MRRSTLLTRALGAGALLAAAAALALAFAGLDTSAPRLDVVGCLAAAAVLTAAWALACRVAPPLPPPAAADPASEVPAIPARLPSDVRDAGRATGFVLVALSPVVLARLAERNGLFGAVFFFTVLFLTIRFAWSLRTDVSRKEARAKYKVLVEDAAAGEVHAIRARVDGPLVYRYHERGDKPGKLSTTQQHCLVLTDAKGEEIPLGTGDRTEVARAGAVLRGTEGWLLFARRYKLIEGRQPVAFVADHGGTTVLGLTNPEEVTYRTATAAARELRPTSRDRATRKVPRTAKFRLPVHGRIAAGALLASLLCLPVLLLDTADVPGLVAYPLCILAGVALIWAALNGAGEVQHTILRDTEWTVREESDPEIA
ncbi:hypothetical protein ABT127_34340 [Streptomyces sp. NPDC001904]|uniref:hypothetical protein n=1 Tax=Streptomyces sp. NPDC001904 TaxID=3154531 RepID=UPI00332A1E99